MTQISAWIREIFLIILAITFMELLLPEGAMAKYVKFIFSIVVLAVILSPISGFCHD